MEDEQPYRTAYHFQPPNNWMNDPNGPMYYKGVYHLFYQYNPKGPVFGNMAWAHSVSYNLVDWIHLDIALNPTDPDIDINGCWSGSTTHLPNDKLAILYTGRDSKKHQVQNLATPKNPSDPFLREWAKSPLNPIISPSPDFDPKEFRDPTTAWLGPDKIWRIVIGAKMGNGKWAGLLFKSSDFENWTRSTKSPFSKLFENNDLILECPDFFPVGINGSDGDNNYMNNNDQYNYEKMKKKYALKVSFLDNKHDYYVLGQYCPETEEFNPESEVIDLRLDYGKFYASKSFYDHEQKRRVIWGWIMESDNDVDANVRGWSGLQSFPRTIVLSESGKQLIQWPIEEIEKLRRDEKVSLQNKELHSDSIFEISGITASQVDIEVSFEIEVSELEEAELINPSWINPQLLCNEKNSSVKGIFGPFGLKVLASNDLSEQTSIFFHIFKTNETEKKFKILMCSDQSRSSLRDGVDKHIYGTFLDLDPCQEKITLRILIDHSIVESFGGEGRSVITARVYPKLAINKGSHLYAFNNGTKSVKISNLNAWSMKNAQFESRIGQENF
ncbi:beta-fructofuranosidase, insoluble isoenzyme CWINV1 [Cannabis sativa]|uniref:beta-fructofuranosidase, insoluble isoenzyme CWINV1 n=1 Tax=Cannabis sativa TaxID=3483 RepID=UPI0029CAA814|nr:beta-fructofuranosidase, insoluble isoenzyme CWINV1 [Cannabis sativa]